MGSDDLFKKSRALKARDLEREKHSRKGQPKVLIICEDSKSSAFYFEDLIKDLRLTAVTVEGSRCDSAPISVVDFAIKEYKKSIKEDKYDRVYCVIDRDTHATYDAALEKIKAEKPKDMFFAITTTPCFEFWLLLHFEYSSASFSKKGKKSPCDCANQALKADGKLPNYGKNKRETYPNTKHKLADAITHAKRLVQENLQNQSSDPQTNMHELIEYLQSIKR